MGKSEYFFKYTRGKVREALTYGLSKTLMYECKGVDIYVLATFNLILGINSQIQQVMLVSIISNFP